MIIRLTTFLHWPVLWPDSEGDLISQNQQCGDGWVQRKSSNSCYFWNTNNLQTYAGAVQECNLMGADLLVINDDDEQVRIVQVLYRCVVQVLCRCCLCVMLVLYRWYEVLYRWYEGIVQVVWKFWKCIIKMYNKCYVDEHIWLRFNLYMCYSIYLLHRCCYLIFKFSCNA